MVSCLVLSGKTQKRSLIVGTEHVCDLKVRFFHGDVQVLVTSDLGKGGFKTVAKVTQLSGPSLPHQPGAIYAYAKISKRKQLREQLNNLELELSDAIESNAPLSHLSELRSKKTTLRAKIDAVQDDLLEEASISKQFPQSNIAQMWVVTSQKDPSDIKGIMMELCDKGDLWDFIHALSFPLSPTEVQRNIGLAASIAKALADMHAEGKERCHLDVKSGNILLSERSGTLVPKLTDFGLSKQTGSLLRHPRGTPAYMAPELYNAPQTALPSMDTWSLGVVCTELFYGQAANKFLWDKDVSAAVRDFFNSKQYSANKLLWERVGQEIKESLTKYPAIDEIIHHLLDLNPLTRWTAEKAAAAFSACMTLTIG